jgi:hypothetical protein
MGFAKMHQGSDHLGCALLVIAQDVTILLKLALRLWVVLPVGGIKGGLEMVERVVEVYDRHRRGQLMVEEAPVVLGAQGRA